LFPHNYTTNPKIIVKNKFFATLLLPICDILC
jgi:hypothetical protein